MNPQSWNGYSYVLNNPLSAVDPTGTDIWFPGPREDPADPECGGGPPPVPPCLFFDCGSNGGGSGQGGNQTAPPPPPPTTTPSAQNQGGVYGCSQNGDPVPCLGTNPSVIVSGILFSTTVFSTAANNGPSWWRKWIPKVPVNLNVIVPMLGIVGPAVTFTYLPQTSNLCVSLGLGASVGRNVSAGPLVLGNLANAKSITLGPSISVGAQATPLRGAQATGNLSGILGGPTVGIPGGSVAATYGICF